MHRAGKLSADRESEADALLCVRCQVSVDLHERLEHAVDVERANTDSSVLDANSHDVVVTVAADLDGAAFACEFDRVRNEIQQNLLKALGVGCDKNLVGAELNTQRQPSRLRLKRAKRVDLR